MHFKGANSIKMKTHFPHETLTYLFKLQNEIFPDIDACSSCSKFILNLSNLSDISKWWTNMSLETESVDSKAADCFTRIVARLLGYCLKQEDLNHWFFMTQKQKELFIDPNIKHVFVEGPTGTGKTFLLCKKQKEFHPEENLFIVGSLSSKNRDCGFLRNKIAEESQIKVQMANKVGMF